MRIITINRQFGSGGREIGKRLSDLLGWDYYDKEIIESLSKKENIDPDYIRTIVMDHACDSFDLGDNKFFSDYGSDELGLQDKLDIIAKKRMHPDEKEKFTTFADFSTIVERVRESEHGYISSIFHILQKDGNYKPEEIVLMPIPGSGSKEFLFCVKMYCEM